MGFFILYNIYIWYIDKPSIYWGVPPWLWNPPMKYQSRCNAKKITINPWFAMCLGLWRLRWAFLKIHKIDFSWAAGRLLSEKIECKHRFQHHTFKNQRPRKKTTIVKPDFQTKARIIEELKNVDDFSMVFFPAADHGHAQHQQLLLWSSSCELL